MFHRQQMDKSSNPCIFTWWNPAVIRKSLFSGGRQGQRCVCMCFSHTPSHLRLEALLAWPWKHSHYLDVQRQLHSWIPNINLFWLFHCSPLWVEQKTKSRTQWEQLGHCSETSPEPSPQLPILLPNNSRCEAVWQKLALTWPADLGRPTFPGGVQSLSLRFNLPEKLLRALNWINEPGNMGLRGKGNYLCLLKMANKWPTWGPCSGELYKCQTEKLKTSQQTGKQTRLGTSAWGGGGCQTILFWMPR